MATYTREQLQRAVLLEVGALDAREAMEADDQRQANDACQQEIERLYELGLIPFDLDSDEIPARYFRPLVMVIAVLLVPSYGAGERASLLASNAVEGEKRLHKLRQPKYIEVETQATYF